MNTQTILAILAIHWFADFVCQTDEMAKNKSKYLSALLYHTTVYTALWSIPLSLMILLGWKVSTVYSFLLITLVSHTITDYFTSRLNSYLWQKGKIHWFFVSVGFDQLLHYTQLFLTYQYLS